MKNLKISLVTLTFFLLSCGGGPGDNKPDEFDAQINMEHYIEERLTSPSSAEFTFTSNLQLDDKTFKMEGYVDSQNGFGAMIRSQFSGTLEYTSNYSKYSVRGFEID